MNRLDSAVEDWLFSDPDERIGTPTGSDSRTIATWAIKTAVMRALLDGDVPDIPAEERAAIQAGDLPDGWHVFATNLTHPSLIHTNVVAMTADRQRTELGVFGMRQVSWALGSIAIIVFYADFKLPDGRDGLDPLRDENASFGFPLAEITRAEQIRSTRSHTASLSQLFWWADLVFADPLRRTQSRQAGDHDRPIGR